MESVVQLSAAHHTGLTFHRLYTGELSTYLLATPLSSPTLPVVVQALGRRHRSYIVLVSGDRARNDTDNGVDNTEAVRRGQTQKHRVATSETTWSCIGPQW